MPTKHVFSELNEVEFLQIYFVANITYTKVMLQKNFVANIIQKLC